MRDDSLTWIDVKFKIEGALLLHLELRGYRSDRGATVQVNYVNDALVMGLEEVLFIPSCTVTVFQGWRVCAISFEVGGQLYACSEGGQVVTLDFPLCHFEVRLTSVSSADAFGHDADRVEFRFCSAQDRLDVACSTIAVPSSWMVVSRVSGPTLVRNARWCRENFARIESPDQTISLFLCKRGPVCNQGYLMLCAISLMISLSPTTGFWALGLLRPCVCHSCGSRLVCML